MITAITDACVSCHGNVKSAWKILSTILLLCSISYIKKIIETKYYQHSLSMVYLLEIPKILSQKCSIKYYSKLELLFVFHFPPFPEDKPSREVVLILCMFLKL